MHASNPGCTPDNAGLLVPVLLDWVVLDGVQPRFVARSYNCIGIHHVTITHTEPRADGGSASATSGEGKSKESLGTQG
jgi:hypothetical protein